MRALAGKPEEERRARVGWERIELPDPYAPDGEPRVLRLDDPYRSALGEAEEGTLYRVDLVGLQVRDLSGAVLGRVEGFFDTGDTGVMVVKGERERMIPFVPEYVKAVDRAARSITVDWKADYDA